MATQAERLAVVETKVTNLDEKIDDLKETIDDTKVSLSEKLDIMYQASCTQHAELAKKLTEVEKFKDKWTYLIMGGIAVIAWLTGHSGIITKLFH